MKRTLAFTAFLVVAMLAALSIDAGAAAIDGKALFLAQKCNMCHSVPTAGIERTTKSEKMAGRDLVNLDKDAASLIKYLKKETDLDGKKHGKAFTGSDEELGALVAWILEQKKQ